MGETRGGGLYAVRGASGIKFVDAKGKEIPEKDVPEELRVRSPTATDEAAGASDGKGSEKAEQTFGELPAGYPGAEAFVTAGLTARAVIEAKTDQELVDLKGIGTATVAKVRDFAKAHPLPPA